MFAPRLPGWGLTSGGFLFLRLDAIVLIDPNEPRGDIPTDPFEERDPMLLTLLRLLSPVAGAKRKAPTVSPE